MIFLDSTILNIIAGILFLFALIAVIPGAFWVSFWNHDKNDD